MKCTGSQFCECRECERTKFLGGMAKKLDAHDALLELLKEVSKQPDRASCASFCRVEMPKVAKKLAKVGDQLLQPAILIMENAGGLRDDDIMEFLKTVTDACDVMKVGR